MTDLFRYIEQSYIVPPANINAIDVSDSSDFQNKIRNDGQSNKSNQDIRHEAENFIAKNPVSDTNFIRTSQQYLDLHERLLALPSSATDNIDAVIENVFDDSAANLAASDAFKKIKHFLNDLIIAVKMTTGFDKVRALDLVAMRQAIAFIETTSARGYQRYSSLHDVKSTLLRPILVPAVFLKKPAEKPIIERHPTIETDEAKKLKALEKEVESLKAAYQTLMSLRPDQLELRDVPGIQRPAFADTNPLEGKLQRLSSFTETPQQVLALNDAAIRKLDPLVLKIFENQSVDIKTTDRSALISKVSAEIDSRHIIVNPCTRVKAVTKIYRVGINAFAVRPDPPSVSLNSGGLPDFSHAITRPVGVGNLQVVRQELLGYEAKEISHIENILEGEILRHSTTRKDTNELILTEEKLTTQFDERDLQSTERNEMVSESQKEAGQQSSSANEKTSTTSYGKLVENNKSNYAKTVTDRAVSSLTQQVRNQRIQREKKSFTEKSFHEFDNSKVGAKNVTGIYQWVDKKYKTRIMNYGQRLLYDVVIPEPAAFLIESLKNAPQAEGLELVKPDVFDLCPDCLNKFNYACLAAKYGVTGSVVPPPLEFLSAVPISDSSMVGPAQTDGFGNKVNGFFFKAFPPIKIPDNYEAVKVYVQMVPPNFVNNPSATFDFLIGESYYVVLKFGDIGFRPHQSFQMNGETGYVPVTFRSWWDVYQYSFAINIICQRTEKALQEWQLKTHAAIMNGYNRQLVEYQDNLSKFQSIIRAQMANAGNYAHNPSIEQGELKKAFIYLLLSEHFNHTYKPTPDPEIIPTDPIYMKNWGAMVAFFERAFEWENIMYTYYPYFWGRRARWGELILIQDISPQFEEFLKAGAARVVVPVRPGFEAALAHYHETGDVWMGEDIPDMFSPKYVSIIQEIKARNFAPEDEILVEEWDVTLPTTLVVLKENATLLDN
jgi:hypothetical protein